MARQFDDDRVSRVSEMARPVVDADDPHVLSQLVGSTAATSPSMVALLGVIESCLARWATASLMGFFAFCVRFGSAPRAACRRGWSSACGDALNITEGVVERRTGRG